MPLPAIAAGALKVGAVLGKVAGATVKGVSAGAKTMGKSAASGTKSFGKSLSRSSQSFKKSFVKRTKIKKDTFNKQSKFRKKLREKRKLRKEEEALEKSNKKQPENPNAADATKRPGGVLQRIVDFISTILIGWVVNKLPQIVEKVENLTENIKNIKEKIDNFFDDPLGGIGSFFKTIGKVIKKSWKKLSNLKFSDTKELIEKAFGGIKSAFGNIFKNLKDGAKNFFGLSKKKGKPEAEPGTQGGKKPEDTGFKSVVGDMKNTMDKMNTDWQDTTKKMEEAATGSELVGDIDGINDGINVNGTKNEKSTGSTKKLSSTDVKTNKKTKTKSKTTIRSADDTTKEGSKVVAKEKAAFAERMAKRRSRTNISNIGTQSTSSITPERKGQDIVIIDQDSSPVPSGSSGKSSSPIIISRGNSLNSLMNQQLLTKLA